MVLCRGHSATMHTTAVTFWTFNRKAHSSLLFCFCLCVFGRLGGLHWKIQRLQSWKGVTKNDYRHNQSQKKEHRSRNHFNCWRLGKQENQSRRDATYAAYQTQTNLEAVIPTRPNLVTETSPNAKENNGEQDDEAQDAVIENLKNPPADGIEAPTKNHHRECEQVSGLDSWKIHSR